ncbi:MAG TPA: hypothetical protein VGT08_11090 [Terracidiphilus sp.]|nr:hypothetical protein [Terracidiphilus sp.]
MSALTGNAFQAEVCARLQSVILDFQTIPAKPHGDAGLDGFSHQGSRGYCCFGPQYSDYKTNKSLESAIINKFREDLRKLLELGFKKKALVCKPSLEMPMILPAGQKLVHVELIVNWFESHRVIGPIHTAFAEYKEKSDGNFVEATATVVIVGPKELANRWTVDEIALIRAKQKGFLKAIQEAAATVNIANPKDFDAKMSILRQLRPDQLAAINRLADELMLKWRTALAFESSLNENTPTLHRLLEATRSRIVTRVSELMLASSQPWTQLSTAESIAQSLLEPDFGALYGSLVSDVASGEIARLIGECPIGWEKATGSHAN